jgi:hypothetical protein
MLPSIAMSMKDTLTVRCFNCLSQEMQGGGDRVVLVLMALSLLIIAVHIRYGECCCFALLL